MAQIGGVFVTHPMMLIIAAVASCISTGTFAAPCARPPNVALEVNVQEAPVAITQDITFDDLKAVSARLGQHPAHPALGFYAGTLGYTLSGIEPADAESGSAFGCPDFRLEAKFLAVDRRIAIARELVGSPCRLRAALDHYRRHADASSVALHRFASGLQAKLGQEIEQRIVLAQGTPAELRHYVDTRLDAALGGFSASLPELQRKVDTKEEVQRLTASCDRT